MASAEDNEDLIRRAMGTMNPASGFAGVEDCFAEGYVRHSSEGSDQTRAEFRATLESLYDAFPDLEVTVEDLVATDVRAAYRWASTGTHKGEYMGIPPTNRRLTAAGITFSRIDDGLVVEEWTSWNKATILRLLGIITLDD
jgi:steroid delta-isomerase-like uncharacterized protein